MLVVFNLTIPHCKRVTIVAILVNNNILQFDNISLQLVTIIAMLVVFNLTIPHCKRVTIVAILVNNNILQFDNISLQA